MEEQLSYFLFTKSQPLFANFFQVYMQKLPALQDSLIILIITASPPEHVISIIRWVFLALEYFLRESTLSCLLLNTRYPEECLT